MADILKQRLIGALLILSVIIGLAIFLVTSANDNTEEAIEVVSTDFTTTIESSPIEFSEVDQETLIDPHKLEQQILTTAGVETVKLPVSLPPVQTQATAVITETVSPVKQANTNLRQKSTLASKTLEVKSETWVIQLASFSKKTNAQALQKKVAEIGLLAKIEQVEKQGKINYRVRIGPENNLQRIDDIVHKVTAELELIPQVLTVQPKIKKQP